MKTNADGMVRADVVLAYASVVRFSSSQTVI